jgi:protein O-mannosyl-transferase
MKLLDYLQAWTSPKRVLVLLICVGFLAYGNSIANGFIWDDEEQIVNNAIIHDLGNIGQIFSGATFSTGGAGLSGYFFRPLITFTFMVNFLFWGENAFGFHLFQVIFHILNGILLFRILLILTSNFKTNYQKLACLTLAIIYIVHPAITEGVVYIAAVSEVMFTFFILLAFYYLLQVKGIRPTLKRMFLVSSLLLAATFYKEPAVVGPPILASYAFIFEIKAWKKWLIFLTGTLLLYFIIRLVIVQTPIQHPLYSNISEASLHQRLITIPSVIFHYLTIIFYPSFLSISQHFVVMKPDIHNFYLSLLVILAVFLGTLFWGFKTGNHLVYFGLAWLVISFGPILNIIPLDMTVAERWLYFPFVGFLILTAAIFKDLKNPALVKVILLILILSIIPLSVRTFVRNQNWKDGLTLYTHDASINSTSFDLENNLGVELFRTNKIAEAKSHFEKSISLQPKWYFALNNLGAVYQHEGNFEKAKELYGKVLTTSDYYLAHENLSSILTHQENDPQKAKEFTEKSLQKLPNNSLLWLNLAISEYKLGNNNEALEASKNAYYLNPNNQTGYIYSQLSQGKELKLD